MDIFVFTEEMVWGCAGVLAFMILDFISGFLGGVMTHSVSSTKIREGILHKSALVIVLVCATFLDILASHVANLPVPTPILVVTCVIIIGMEIVSIMENAVIINPGLKDSGLMRIFDQVETDKKDGEQLE